MASREPGEYAFTPPLGGRDFHPYRDISYQGSFPCLLSPRQSWFQKNTSHAEIYVIFYHIGLKLLVLKAFSFYRKCPIQL